MKDELDRVIGARILGWAQEKADEHYVMLTMTGGRNVVFRSESPINVEVETEQ